jgi:hypothetical protein
VFGQLNGLIQGHCFGPVRREHGEYHEPSCNEWAPQAVRFDPGIVLSFLA